jgi:NADH-quinone oxidoreductase subunit K
MAVPALYHLSLSALLFTLGMIGVLVRRSALIVFMSIELMLNAVHLSLVTFARVRRNLGGGAKGCPASLDTSRCNHMVLR